MSLSHTSGAARHALRLALPFRRPAPASLIPQPPRRGIKTSPTLSQRQPITLDTFSASTSTTASPTSNLPFIPPGPIELLPLPRSINYSRALLLLSLPIAPVHWPPKLPAASPLLASTLLATRTHEIALNFVYDGHGSSTSFEPSSRPGGEAYPAQLFYPDGKVFDFTQFDQSVLSTPRFLEALAYQPGAKRLPWGCSREEVEGVKQEVVVCTHGSRDCRCADRGGALVEAMRKEVERRGLQERISVKEIAHVGGHKYAANAILLPSLDMLSNLRSSHAPALISHILSGRPRGSGIWAHWRGRYGLTEEEQGSLWSGLEIEEKAPGAGLGGQSDSQAEGNGQGTGKETAGSKGTGKAGERERIGEPRTGGAEVLLRFRTWEGDLRELRAGIGKTLMSVGKEEGLPALEGTCGGNLECATCHLYLPPSPSAGPPPILPAEEEELDMLGYAIDYREGESRLGCQIRITNELGAWVGRGGEIKLARY